MIRFLGAAVLAAATMLAMPSAAEELDSVLDRTRIAYGGDVLPGPGTLIRSQGRILSASRSKSGTVLREASWPEYLRVEITYEDGARESRVMLGADGWRDGAPTSGPMVAAMRLQAARLSLPMILWWERAALTDMGMATREDGVVVHRLRLDLADDLALFVEIEDATGHILRSAGVMTMGGAEMAFGAAYSEFRPFGAAIWPGHEDQSAMGQAIGWTKIDELELGLPFNRDGVKP